MTVRKEIKCVHCKKAFIYADSPFRPFCSERCKSIDLGHWLNESYQIPSQAPLGEEDIEEIERHLEQDEEDA